MFGVLSLIFSLCVGLGGDTIRERDRERELFGFWDLLLVWDWLVLLHGWILLLFIEGVDCWGLESAIRIIEQRSEVCVFNYIGSRFKILCGP